MVAPSHLRSFQALELAIRLGSLKAAAQALAITPAAVGQRIKALEDYLGIDLLVRGRSGLQPTPALQTALPSISGAFRALEEASTALDLQRGHEIHIAAPPDFADLWLAQRLDRFRAAHPAIRFVINGAGDSPARTGAPDCEVSFAAPHDSADTLFHDYVLPISSPDILRRVARVPRRERLEGFPLLHLDFYRQDADVRDWAHWAKANKVRRTAPERGLRLPRIAGMLDAILANAGLTLCGLALVTDMVDDQRIALPFGAGAGNWTSHVFQARFRRDALNRPQIRRFRDWLLAEAVQTRRWLERIARSAPAS